MAKIFKPGDVVFYAALSVDDSGTVKRCEVRRLYIVELYPNYLQKYGLRYAARRKQDVGRGEGYGMTYKPESLHATQAEAEQALSQKVIHRIRSLERAKADFKTGTFVE